MKEDNVSNIFRSLRADTCEKFLPLAAGNLDITGDLGRTLLHEAIAHAKIDSALALIEMGAQLNAKDGLGRTPLHYAAMFNQAEVMKTLIATGGDVNAVDNFGNNPLWTAILNPKIDHEIIGALKHAGSDCKVKNKSGKSVEDMAAMIDNLDIIRILENGQ